jgi:hypothetical protein
MRHVTEQVNHPPLLEEGEGDTLFRSNFIMEQGTVGQEMYVIITGDAVVVEQDGLKIGTLNSGDFFGEPVPERGSPSLVLHCSASYYTAVGLRGACFVRACSVVWCGAVRCGAVRYVVWGISGQPCSAPAYVMHIILHGFTALL